MILGCIADDFTGATDLASTLVQQGMRTVQVTGGSEYRTQIDDAEAVVVALKSRTTSAKEAIDLSLQALAWLSSNGARQIFFKYCSTFDSTNEGNIGPVADALLTALGEPFTIACPAYPSNGRTVYQGYLFVGNQLLSESPMKDHPLTPMRDANLLRVLGAQVNNQVGLVDRATVSQGAVAVGEAYDGLIARGCRFAVVDALADDDLLILGEASAKLRLITGGSGVALGLPENYRREGLIGAAAPPSAPRVQGRRAVLAGSCSAATRAQVDVVRDLWPSFEIDPLALAAGVDVAAAALAWAGTQDVDAPILIFSSAAPEAVARVQAEVGREQAGALVESVFRRISHALVSRGVRQLIVAGGETAGAVVSALGVTGLRIGPEIDPGVPWCEVLGEPRMALALKSGNFGSEHFFEKAFSLVS